MSKSTKKILLISIILAISIAAGIFIYALSNANKLIATFKPQLEETISKALNTKVSIGEITASIFPETAFRISSLNLEQVNKQIVGPKFEELLVKLDLSGLLSAKLIIKEVLIRSPELKFIKPKDSQEAPKDSHTGQKADTQATSSEPQSASPLAINLDSFRIENAKFEFEDQQQSKSYQISNLNLSTSLSVQDKNINLKNLNLSLLALNKIPFKFSLPELTFSDNKLNIENFISNLSEQIIKGKLNFNLASKSGLASISSDGLDLNELLKAAISAEPKIPALDLSGKIAPAFQANINNLSDISSSGKLVLNNIAVKQGIFAVSELNGNIDITANTPDKAELHSADINFKLNDQTGSLAFKVKHQNKVLDVSEVLLKFLSGQINSELNFNLNSKDFSSKVKASNLQISQALALINKTDLPFGGTINQLTSDVKGTVNEKPVDTLKGQIQANIVDGAIKGFNLAGMVLKAVNNLPFLTGSLYSSVPDSQKAAIDSSDTAFSSITANLNLAAGQMNIQNFTLISPTFTVEGKGSIGFDKSLSLKSTIYFSQAFSSVLVSATPQLKYGLDSQSRLAIPLSISGTAPSVTVLPDVQKIIETSGKKVLAEKAGEVASDFLKKKGLGGLLGF